jgi:hypothetical protein
VLVEKYQSLYRAVMQEARGLDAVSVLERETSTAGANAKSL